MVKKKRPAPPTSDLELVCSPFSAEAFAAQEEDEAESEVNHKRDGVSLPPGAIAWDQVLEPPVRFAPWPYSCEEFAVIGTAIPQPPSEACLDCVLLAARWYVARMNLRKSEPPRSGRWYGRRKAEPPKPNPRDELARVHGAAIKLQAAITALSPQARKHLADNLRPVRAPGEKPFTEDTLSHALLQFEHENRWAFENLPVVAAGGLAPKLADQRLVFLLLDAYKVAHGGKVPKRGWPKFRSACVDPLRKFGLVARSEKAWQDVLQNAKKRAEK